MRSAFNRFASRAEAAIVTARQCRQPSNSFTALMNAANSRSAICVCSLQIDLESVN
jgi:hypothetical protein